MSILHRSTIAGVSVPSMAIGTWAWGDSTWNYDPAKDLENIKQAWHTSIHSGLSFFDTAEAYGKGECERIIGGLLKETSESDRKSVYIATKFLPFPTPQNFFIFTPAVVPALKKSLQRLGVDSVDLYLIHSASGPHSVESLGEQLAKCVQLGLAKAVGVSNFNKDELIRIHNVLEKHNVKLSCNQIEYSLLRQHPEENGLLSWMKEHDVACLAYSPLGMGRLTGKYSAANPPPKKRWLANHQTWEELDPLIQELKSIAETHGVTPSAVAINWVICKGAIPLGGARNSQQAEQNAKALTFTLTEEEVKRLSALGFAGKTGRFWQHG